jgi:hypothetical protein
VGLHRQGEFSESFTPAVSGKAAKARVAEIRRWQIHRKSGTSLEDLSRRYNRVIRGWVNYYGIYHRSALAPVFSCLN